MKTKTMLGAWIWLMAFFVITMALFNVVAKSFGEQQYVLLAESFLQGRTDISFEPKHSSDLVLHNNKYYWPLGPTPAIFLTVPVWVFAKAGWGWFDQGKMQFLMNIGVWGTCIYLARRSKYGWFDAVFMGFVFVFASVYQFTAMTPWTWYLVQTMTVFLTMLALCEWKSASPRHWVIGILMGLVFAARFTAGLVAVFFGLGIMLEKSSAKDKFAKLWQLLLPIVLSGSLLLVYNHARFGNMWDNGYETANNFSMNLLQRYELTKHGLFKVTNIPTNLYYYFLKGLDPVREDVETLNGNTHMLKWPFLTVNYPGTSFFVVSPIFLYLFGVRLKNKEDWLVAGTAGVILAMLLTYYWSGWRQLGPRYLLDLMPLVYLLFLKAFPERKLTNWIRMLAVASAGFNLYLWFGVMRFV